MSTIAQPIKRRAFLKVSALAGGGLALGFTWLSKQAQAQGLAAEAFAPNAFLKIDAKGIITLMAPNPEIGQGIKTAIPMVVAEEMDLDWTKIKVEQAPLDTKGFARQVAGGSYSIRGGWDSYRQAGATAREMLKAAAAKEWGVSVSDCKSEDSFIIHTKNGKKLSYAELASKAAAMPVPENPSLKDPKEYKLLGRRIPGVDNQKVVTGTMDYGIDYRKEGMRFALIARPPAFGKKLESVDDSEALKIKGVDQVIRLDDHKVAVLADGFWEAKKGRDALKLRWSDSELESSEEHVAAFKKNIEKVSDAPKRNSGNALDALKKADKVLESTFEAPFLPHACMEPMNFFAHVQNDKVELYGPTQTPALARKEVAALTGLPEEKVSVMMSKMGGGFGRRLKADFVVEAAEVSKKSGKPVLVIWTREDDMQGGFYRPAGMYHYKAAIKNGKLEAWHCTATAINSPNATRENNFPAGCIPHYRVDSHNQESNISVGPWRAPNHNIVAFTEESFIDEIAHELKKDPIDFRLELLEQARKQPGGEIAYDIDRYEGVVKEVARMANWGKAKPGRYQGFGAHYSFGSYVAQVAELSMEDNKIKVHKVYCAVDCGRVINVSGAENQIEGGIIDGLGHALYGSLSLNKGKVDQPNFNQYQLGKMKDAPAVEMSFINREARPEGVGEPGLPPIPAAVGNAIFAATGKRIRRLPLKLEGLA